MARGTGNTITKADEKALVREAQAGDNDAMTELLALNARAIAAEVKRYERSGNSQTWEDLTQAANIGFIVGVRKADPDNEGRLWSFARNYVTKAINDERTSLRAVTVPEDTQRTYEAATRAAADLDEARELAHSKHGMSAKTFDAAHAALSAVPTGVADHELIGRPLWVSEGTAAVEARDEAAAYLAKLDDKAREVVALSVGLLGDGEPMTDTAIAALLGLTRPTVQRIRTRALAALRPA